jgi:diguanylate cyclase (GGDEF)-like protein
MVMASFVFVLLVPIGFFIYSLFQNSWEQAEQEMLEKHELISTALVEPYSLYISSRQRSLQTVGEDLLHFETAEDEDVDNVDHEKQQKHHNIQRVLDRYIKSFDDFVAVSYVTVTNPGHSQQSIHQHSHLSTSKNDTSQVAKPDYSYLNLSALAPLNKNKINVDFLSPVFNSPISNTPVVLLKHNILDINNKVTGTLCVEVSLGYIGNMCSKINFGVKGHCAVVDQAGHVIAHPNKEWVKNIRDLSKISIVQKMLSGESGTTEFYSPFLKENMVAGFSSIPSLGWGIMIPQPKKELTHAFDQVKKNTLIWLSLGIIIALLISFKLTKRITKPINTLMSKTNQVEKSYSQLNLGPVPDNSPYEISQLWRSFSQLLSGLEKSNKEIKRLNLSLSNDIKKTKEKLNIIKKNFYEISSKDYLTSLHNRSYFASHLQKFLNQKSKETVGIILIDIDNFENINNKYGYRAGDLALQQLSKVILESISKGALAARMRGDEFAIIINNNSDDEMAKIAEKLRKEIAISPTHYNGESFYLTVSIGTVNHKSGEIIRFEEFLIYADEAMNISKLQGRNMVTAYEIEASKSIALTF